MRAARMLYLPQFPEEYLIKAAINRFAEAKECKHFESTGNTIYHKCTRNTHGELAKPESDQCETMRIKWKSVANRTKSQVENGFGRTGGTEGNTCVPHYMQIHVSQPSLRMPWEGDITLSTAHLRTAKPRLCSFQLSSTLWHTKAKATISTQDRRIQIYVLSSTT
jgi:hypothetical protein